MFTLLFIALIAMWFALFAACDFANRETPHE